MSWLYFIPPYTYHDIAADKDGYARYGDNVVFIFHNGLFYLEQKNILQ